MAEAKLSAKHQVVVPREAREALGLQPGDRLTFVVRSGRFLVVRKAQSLANALYGLHKKPYRKKYLEEERSSWETPA